MELSVKLATIAALSSRTAKVRPIARGKLRVISESSFLDRQDCGLATKPACILKLTGVKSFPQLAVPNNVFVSISVGAWSTGAALIAFVKAAAWSLDVGLVVRASREQAASMLPS